VLFQFCQDVAKPYEPLYNEVIPAPQRGRAGTIRNVLVNLTQVVFNAVMLAQFDRQYQFTAGGSAWRLSGEMVIYWSGSAVVAAVLLFLIFRVREVRPRAAVVERFRFAKFFRDIFGERQWWFIYLLFACPQLGGLGIATFVPLFETEQLGFSKQQVGTSGAATMLLTLVCFVPLAGFLSDRVSRLRLFQVGLVGPALVNFALFLVVRHSSDHRIAFSTLLAFNALSGGLLSLLFVVWGPLVYDYVPSHRFGTVSAGFSFVSGVAGFLLLNAAGRWIKLFDPAAGSGRAALFDYSSIYVLQLLGAGVALAWTIYFQREVRRGRIIAHGQLEAAQS
jgi:Na+/melibiose symporter-like transporter